MKSPNELLEKYLTISSINSDKIAFLVEEEGYLRSICLVASLLLVIFGVGFILIGLSPSDNDTEGLDIYLFFGVVMLVGAGITGLIVYLQPKPPTVIITKRSNEVEIRGKDGTEKIILSEPLFGYERFATGELNMVSLYLFINSGRTLYLTTKTTDKIGEIDQLCDYLNQFTHVGTP